MLAPGEAGMSKSKYRRFVEYVWQGFMDPGRWEESPLLWEFYQGRIYIYVDVWFDALRFQVGASAGNADDSAFNAHVMLGLVGVELDISNRSRFLR